MFGLLVRTCSLGGGGPRGLPCTMAALLASLSAPALAQRPLEGVTAPRWRPCLSWVTNPPAKYAVSDENGALVFTAEGAGTELPWLIALSDDETTGDARYLLLHYRAEGLSNQPGNYLVHGQEGTPGGLTYAASNEAEPDGAWHTLAVDLPQVGPQGPTTGLAVKAIVGEGGEARLTIDRIWFADELPPGAKVARAATRERQTVALDWRQVEPLKPAPGWITNPADGFSATVEGAAATFVVRGVGRAMRWPLALPQPVDLGQLSYLSVRYRASGQLGATTYAIWLGDDASGAGGHACVPLYAGDLKADGRWHTVPLRLTESFVATQLAVGLDCAGDEASLMLDTLEFAACSPVWPVAKVLPYTPRAGAWPDAQDGWTVLSAPVSGGKPSAFLAARLCLSDWFTSADITVGGVPFSVPTDAAQVLQSGTTELGVLSLPLPAETTEVYLLTATTAPPNEPWGIDWQHPRPVEVLAEPEKVAFEVRYAQGASDFALPLDAETSQWGLRRGLSVCVVHPDPARRATEVLLHDGMQTAAFALLGAAMRTDAPRVAEPTWEHLAYAPPPAGALRAAPLGSWPAGEEATVSAGRLRASFGTDAGLTWSALGVPGLPEALSCAASPVFEVTMGGQVLPNESWVVERTEAEGARRRFALRHAATDLAATVECLPGGDDELLLRMSLRNDRAAPMTATLRFPVLRGVCLGRPAETWYLSGKRGGIINSAPASFRDPLGEPHPLQMDGFFSPKGGLALACLTHATAAQHHYLRLAKSAEGGEWSPEYVERDIAPGGTFSAAEAALVLREGDWRAIFGAYREWLATWFRPVVPRLPWFERTFCFITRGAHYDSFPDPRERGAIQPTVDSCLRYLGVCDYVHLFGWSSSKAYGDWGDYDHYDEAVGGLDYFRGNITRAQEADIAVGLYQDGYLSCEKGQSVGAHAREWAMRNADGSPNYIKEYDAYNQCPYLPGWQQYLSETYARLHRDLGAKGMYVDEYGATDGRWMCYARDHGHSGCEVPYAGEVAMLKRIREAVGPEVALYTEYPPAEVSRRYVDGSFTYQALWSVDQEPLAPHFIDLPRFAFPDFKQFHIIYYVAPRAGNWWLLKFPFFNGESYDLGEPNLPGYDAPAMAFQRRAIEVLCGHREAFSSREVEPLVRTEVAGVFANAFRAPQETVWTLYNANGRSVRAPVLRVKHVPEATYEDAWGGKGLTPEVTDGFAYLAVELGPKAVGCVVQRR